jgi:hypothetical protein
MKSIFERLQKIVGGSQTEGSAAEVQTALEEVEGALEKARIAQTNAHADHDAKVLALIASGDEKAMDQGRQKVAESVRRVVELERVAGQLRERLQRVQGVEAAAELSGQWQEVESMMEARLGCVSTLQNKLDELAAAFQAVTDLNIKIWKAIPTKPNYGAAPTYQRDLAMRVSIYLFGVSDGKLGNGAVTPYLARQRKDLITEAKGANEYLLMPSKQPAKEAA